MKTESERERTGANREPGKTEPGTPTIQWARGHNLSAPVKKARKQRHGILFFAHRQFDLAISRESHFGILAEPAYFGQIAKTGWTRLRDADEIAVEIAGHPPNDESGG